MAKGDSWKELAVSACGLGYLPIAPGTWASAAATLAYTYGTLWFSPELLKVIVAALVLLCLAAGIALGRWAQEYYGAKDPKQFVLDELAGQWVTLLAMSVVTPWESFLLIALLFLAFRFFDIVKPFPIRWLERLPGGWGIMADDLFAGLYAALFSVINLYLYGLFLVPW